MDFVLTDDLKIVLVGLAAIFFMWFVVVFVPLGYYLEFKGRYYREKWFEAENKRRAEHPEQFNNLSYRIVDFFRFGKKNKNNTKAP